MAVGSERFALIKANQPAAAALVRITPLLAGGALLVWVQNRGGNMTFAKELDQLIAKHLGSKATFGDYLAAIEALWQRRNTPRWCGAGRIH